MLQSNLKIKARHSSRGGTKSGQHKAVQIRRMVTCTVEKSVRGSNNKGSFQSKSISTEGQTCTSRNWKKFYLHRKGNIQRKENHQHRCRSWNCICEQGKNREAHRKTAGRPKRSGELSPPLFHILDIELMGIKLKTKQTKSITY